MAVVHAELLLIHPFRDGNGRLARWLADLMAVQAGLPVPDYALSGRGSTTRQEHYVAAVRQGYIQNYAPAGGLLRGGCPPSRALTADMRAGAAARRPRQAPCSLEDGRIPGPVGNDSVEIQWIAQVGIEFVQCWHNPILVYFDASCNNWRDAAMLSSSYGKITDQQHMGMRGISFPEVSV
jgi:hypothetical protein